MKDTRNCLTATGLGAKLLAWGVRRLAITGISMEQCCETTARVGADIGYAIDFVTDATLTFPIPNHEAPGEELGVEDPRQLRRHWHRHFGEAPGRTRRRLAREAA